MALCALLDVGSQNPIIPDIKNGFGLKKSLSLSLSYKLKLGLKRIGSKFIIIKQCVVWMLSLFVKVEIGIGYILINPRPASWVFFVESDYCSGMSLNSSS